MKMRIPLFDYTFYRIYHAFKQGKNKDPLFSTLSVMILVFGGIFTYLFEQFDLYQYLPGEKGLVIIYGFFFGLLYFFFAHKKRYLEIEKRYLNESNKGKTFGIVFLVTLAVITLGAYFGFFIIELQ